MNEPEPKDIPRSIGGFVRFIWGEIVRQRKWVLIPVWILLAACALAILFGGSTLLPVIYIAF